MNGDQICKYLEKDLFTKSIFKGLITADIYPKHITQFPSLYVANTDTASGPGEHWTVCYFTDFKNAEFFDSFGIEPNMYGFWPLFDGFDIIKNNKRLQSFDSPVCGAYCIFFSMYRCRNISLYKICSLFTKAYDHNDMLVYEFMKNRKSE
jgi:hypothetical protein